MSVIFDEKNGLISLHTKNTTYQMKVDQHRTLLHTYYGGRIDNTDMSAQIMYMDRGFSGNPYEMGAYDRTYSLDILPQEYSCFGTGDYRITSLHVHNQNGSKASQLKFLEKEVITGKYGLNGLPAVYAGEEAQSLRIVLQDEESGLQAELLYGVLEGLDLITRSVRIKNLGTEQVTIKKAASLCLDIQFGSYDWITFYGRHTMERNVERQSIRHGIQSMGSVRGNSSHHYNPFSIICEPETTETTGKCFGFSFLYSGEFLMEIEKDQMDQTRFICGIHPDNFLWIVEPGEVFEAPEVMMSFSDAGLEKLSHCFHRTIRDHICRGKWKNIQRPVLINNWEATGIDFTGDKLLSIAKEAIALGIDLFVMDDGWFGARDNDDCALGDWYANEKKLGCTLKEFGDKITETGIKFGIWFEPEAISEDSNLYRRHPDWAVAIPGRKPSLSRNQLVLDFSREDVCQYIIDSISAVLEEAPVSYVKWDMNRNICDKYSNALDVACQGEFGHRFILGLYNVLETLLKKFPDVLFEGCSGGGGRFDAGMLYYTPQIWCSDNTDAVNRLNIQYGTSFAYPVSTMGAHVSAVPNYQTGHVTPFHTRGIVAMAGTFGYELDITKLTREEKEQVREQIQVFHKLYQLIQYGDYYRLSKPDDVCTVWEIASSDGKEALVSGVYHNVEANPAPVHVYIRGLDTNEMYMIQILDMECCADCPWPDGCIMSGSALQNGGITVPLARGEYDAWQILIRKATEGGKE